MASLPWTPPQTFPSHRPWSHYRLQYIPWTGPTGPMGTMGTMEMIKAVAAKDVTKAVAAKALYAGVLPRFGRAGARTVVLTATGISAGVALSQVCGGGGGGRSSSRSSSSSSMRDIGRKPPPL